MATQCKCEPITNANIVQFIYRAYMQSVRALTLGYREDRGATIIGRDFVIAQAGQIFNLQQQECIEASFSSYTVESCTECDNESPLPGNRHYRKFLIKNKRDNYLRLNILKESSIVRLDAWIDGETPPISFGYPTPAKAETSKEPAKELPDITDSLEDAPVDWDKEFEGSFDTE